MDLTRHKHQGQRLVMLYENLHNPDNLKEHTTCFCTDRHLYPWSYHVESSDMLVMLMLSTEIYH